MTSPRPFRFGVLAGPVRGADELRRDVRRAEDLGYSSFLVPDHLGQEWGPLVTLAAAAEHSRRLALGTLMLAVDLRRPVVLYKELATLAQLAPGRLEIGVGAGWLHADFTRAGVAFDPPSTRIERLDEAVTILKGLWERPRFSMEGKHYSIADAWGEPRPPAAPPPRWTLGGGGQRVLAVAARHADIISMSARLSTGGKDAAFGASATAGAFVQRARLVRQLAGDRMADIELQTLVFAAAIVSDSGRYADRVLSRMFGLPAAEALTSPLALVGTVDEVCERLAAHRELLGTSYWVIPAAQMTGFADVVAKLSGG